MLLALELSALILLTLESQTLLLTGIGATCFYLPSNEGLIARILLVLHLRASIAAKSSRIISIEELRAFTLLAS